MPTSDWEPVPAKYDFSCRICGCKEIKYQTYEPSDEAFTDYHYHCNGCGWEWWVEGSDS